MRILYVGMKFDYGKPTQGLSFEHYTFFETFRHIGMDIIYFDFISLLQKYGREKMNQLLLDVVTAEKPDLLFSILFTNEFAPETIAQITSSKKVVTLNWFCDDHWRFESYSKMWAPCFNWVVTTAQSALPKYKKIGYGNVIKSQWACNHFVYQKQDMPLIYDVTFVGQPHGNRRDVIGKLRQAGISVQTWGQGWENGRLSQADMIRVFNQSRINLNLANSSVQSYMFLRRILRRVTRAIPSLTAPCDVFNKFLDKLTRDNLQVSQIKGRTFEIPGCGGFLLTEAAENLDEYFLPGREAVTFLNSQDLISKVQYFLSHENERRKIADLGYHRTIKDHTYVHRFRSIFNLMGLGCEIKPGQLGSLSEIS